MGKFSTRVVEGHELITYQGKIVVPKTLQSRIIAWYHQYLAHPGSDHMEKTLNATLTWAGLHSDVTNYVRTCRKCQLCKKQRKKYGHLPAKEAEPPLAWNRVNVDMVGPYTVKTPTKTYELRALTMIDPATGWFEVKDISAATSDASCKTGA